MSEKKQTINKQQESYKSAVLVEAAGDLLYIITIIRQGSYKIAGKQLSTLVSKKIDELTSILKQEEFLPDEINDVTYMLCAAIDEASLTSTSNLVEISDYESLISYYYSEEFGGDNFFKILDNLINDHLKNLPLIKLGYLLLSLGFKGKYAIDANGTRLLDEIREKLYLLVLEPNYSPALFIDNVKPNYNYFDKVQFISRTNIKIIIIGVIILISAYVFSLWMLNQKKEQIHDLILEYCL